VGFFVFAIIRDMNPGTSQRPLMTPVLPPEAQSRIAGELQPGEKLIWAAQPIPALYARSGWGLAIFGIFFGGFALFWIAMAGGMMWFSNDGPPGGGSGIGKAFSCFPLFGLPFLAIGVGMLTAPIWMRRNAARTVYGLTDRRAILCQGKTFGGVEVRSFGPPDLTHMTRVERANGTGDLIFREVISTSYDSEGDRRTNRTRIGFIAIERVRDVENLVRTQLMPMPGPPPA
jgi:hypothetical protein